MNDELDPKVLRKARESEGYYELGLYEDALDRAEALLVEGSLERFALAMKAECLRSLERYGEGVDVFEEIILLSPDDVGAYVGLGWCRKRSGRLDLAIDAMNRLLEARPDEPIGLFNLACYLALKGDRDRALSLLARSIRKDEQFREVAKKEEDFAPIRDDPEFQRTISEDQA